MKIRRKVKRVKLDPGQEEDAFWISEKILEILRDCGKSV